MKTHRPWSAGSAWTLVVALFLFATAGAAAQVPPAAGPPPATVVDEEDDFGDDDYAQPQVSDPFQRYNRTMFKVNETIMNRAIRPVSRGYQRIVPEKARRGLGSFFNNLAFPVRAGSSLLQGKVDRCGLETGKFLINSTAGLGGFIKVSDRVEVMRDVPAEDFGQTLGVWGIKPGPFIVLPVLGPSSLRDVFGRFGDQAAYPLNWHFTRDYPWEVMAGVRGLDTVNSFPDIVDGYDMFRRAAIDPYVAFRNGYLQFREAAVKK